MRGGRGSSGRGSARGRGLSNFGLFRMHTARASARASPPTKLPALAGSPSAASSGSPPRARDAAFDVSEHDAWRGFFFPPVLAWPIVDSPRARARAAARLREEDFHNPAGVAQSRAVFEARSELDCAITGWIGIAPICTFECPTKAPVMPGPCVMFMAPGAYTIAR